MIKENLEKVRANINKACEDAGRDPKEVTLIAVSKTKPVSMIREAYDLGVRDFGENKAQELRDKYEELPKDIRWHMIGHLQRNKVKYVVGRACLIHSVDSYELAEEISKVAVKKGVECDILIEVNAAGEESKFGVSPSECADLVKKIALLPAVHIKGLMTVAPYVAVSEENFEVFTQIMQLGVDITDKNIDNVNMNVFSMGMSGDYETAIKCGATYVRVGTGIFGERNYNK